MKACYDGCIGSPISAQMFIGNVQVSHSTAIAGLIILAEDEKMSLWWQNKMTLDYKISNASTEAFEDEQHQVNLLPFEMSLWTSDSILLTV